MSDNTNKITPYERLKDIIALMMFQDSYWGYLFSRLRRIEDQTLNTISAVSVEEDGSLSLIFNPLFFDGTSDETLRFVLEHEGVHIINNHISRKIRILSDEVIKERKKQKIMIWDISADISTNGLIKNIPDVVKIGPINEWKLCKAKVYNLPDRKTAEYYYYELLDKNKGDNSGGSMKIQISSGTLLDDHGQWIKKIYNKVPDLDSLSRRVETFTSSIAIDSYRDVRDRGLLPSGIQELINDLFKPPTVPYYQIISKLIKGSKFSKFKRAYSRINRKRTYLFVIGDNNLPTLSPFPGKTRDFTFTITIIIDTSGSMTRDDIIEGLSGIKNMIENDRYVKVTVIECDAKVQKEYKVKKLQDIQFNMKGRGGTELFPALSRSKELGTDVTLTFTDGLCDNINNISRTFLPKKMFWAITKGGRSNMVDNRGFVITLDKGEKNGR